MGDSMKFHDFEFEVNDRNEILIIQESNFDGSPDTLILGKEQVLFFCDALSAYYEDHKEADCAY